MCGFASAKQLIHFSRGWCDSSRCRSCRWCCGLCHLRLRACSIRAEQLIHMGHSGFGCHCSSGCGSNNSRRDQRIIGLGSCVCFCWGCIGAKQLIHIQRLCWLSVDWGRRHNGVSSRCALRLGLLAAAMAAEAGIASEGAMTFPAGGCRRCCAGRRRGFLSASGAERRAVR